MGRCYNTTVIDAPVNEVWQRVRDFHDLSWAAGVITKVDRIGDAGGTEPGAKRILNDVFHETLMSLDDDTRSFSYTIDDGPGPVAKEAVRSYVGSVQVLPVTDRDASFVEWQSNYETDDDGAVGEFCNPIYQALLGALKQSFAQPRSNDVS